MKIEKYNGKYYKDDIEIDESLFNDLFKKINNDIQITTEEDSTYKCDIND